MNTLPCESFMHILSFVPPKDLLKCREVCKYWKKCASDQTLWAKFFPQHTFPAFRPNRFFLSRKALSTDSIDSFIAEAPRCSGKYKIFDLESAKALKIFVDSEPGKATATYIWQAKERTISLKKIAETANDVEDLIILKLAAVCIIIMYVTQHFFPSYLAKIL